MCLTSKAWRNLRELVRNVVRYNEQDFGVRKESGLGIRKLEKRVRGGNAVEENEENQKNENETRKEEHVQEGEETKVNEEEVEEIEQEQMVEINEVGS